MLISLVLAVLTAHAQELPQESPVPGGVAIVPIAPDSEFAPVVYFAGNRVMVVRHNGRWRAVVGLSLTLEPGPQTLVASNSNGQKKEYSFMVRPKKYAEQRLELQDRRMVEPTAEDLARIAREQEIIRSIFATWTEQWPSSLRFHLPAQGHISSVFGLRRFFNNEPRQPHSGLDIAAPVGAPVVAPLAGTVVEVGEYFFNGKTLFLDHGQGLVSMFNHLSSIAVERGARVAPGQQIGEVGMSGRVTGPHLHWTVSLNNSRVDPELFLPGENGGASRRHWLRLRVDD